MPLVNCQVFCGLAVSYRGTAAFVRFRSSTYSDAVPAGLYISSLMTTGPTSGAVFSDPNVGADSGVKSEPPAGGRAQGGVGGGRVAGDQRVAVAVRVGVPRPAVGEVLDGLPERAGQGDPVPGVRRVPDPPAGHGDRRAVTGLEGGGVGGHD